MGETVQLVNMKQYTLEKLSKNGESVPALKINGVTRDSSHLNGTLRENGHQNGFISNTSYADWDTNMSPPTSPKDGGASPDASPPKPKLKSRPSSAKPKEKFIPEHEIDIPKDGSLHDFSTDDMSTFFRYMGVEERIVNHVHKKGLDGLKFSKLKDSDLEGLGMKNPIMCHFRDKSTREKGSKKKKAPFML